MCVCVGGIKSCERATLAGALLIGRLDCPMRTPESDGGRFRSVNGDVALHHRRLGGSRTRLAFSFCLFFVFFTVISGTRPAARGKRATAATTEKAEKKSHR